uniref:Uncharacterized protein n=1 Tax=Cricetulus griseus TaxID=10029 RepID=A0A8C2MZW5_CRIGR
MRGGPDRDALSSQTAACRHHAWAGLQRPLANRCRSPHRRPLGRCLHSDSHSQNSILRSAPEPLAIGRGLLVAPPSPIASRPGSLPGSRPGTYPCGHRDEPCGNHAA